MSDSSNAPVLESTSNPDSAAVNVRSARFEPLAGAGHGPATDPASIELLMDVPLQITVELGRTRMNVRQVLELQSGSVVELDRLAGEPVDVVVNDRLMARGEVVVVDDRFGIRITEIIAHGRRGTEN